MPLAWWLHYTGAMGMSHAAAVWVPGTDVAPEALERMIREGCEHEGLDVELFVRSEPAASVAVAALDDHDEFQMEFDLFDRTAAALARTLKRRVYALYAFFGSGDWMTVNAMSETGEPAWSEASSDDGDPALLEELSDKLGVEVNGLTQPYWRLVAEVAPGCQDDLLAVGIKPAFDLGFIDGWRSTRRFVTPGLEPGNVDTPAKATGRMSASDVEDLLSRTLAKMFPASSTPPPEEVPARRNDSEDVISRGLAMIAKMEARTSGRPQGKAAAKETKAPAKAKTGKPPRKPAARATTAKKKAAPRKPRKR